ncbi:hypothetical protein MTR67_023579 [Solanum verrucosum]|uniref:RNase H type-1 domain-containing protein n=1 Tax=Solanum verrucosum TaxID=315347 RepID=A0AAF0QTQ8_SOLVR|nr:hypothetical protein MTR67_023579 [Solanum verrucosum]
MMKNKHTVESHIQWKIRNESCSFWWDNWLGVGPLAQYTTASNRFNNESISEFIEEGQWKMNKVIQTAPSCQVHNILSTQLHLQNGQPDLAVWTPNTNGLFSVSSALNCIRDKREKTKINTYSWQKIILFKCSFLLWREIRGKLLTNEKIASFGIEPSECHCCHSLVFPYISWPWEWSKLCTLIKKCTHDIKVTVVHWIKLPDKRTKLNTDGSALSNPGSTGAGGILRNHFGDIIFAFSAPLGEGTNNQAEVETPIFGLSWCVHLKYKKVILEVDSQLQVDWLMSSTTAPWSISAHVQKLQHLTTQFTHFKCSHTLREANFVTDSLSKHSHQLTSPQLYFSIQQLPKLTAAYL